MWNVQTLDCFRKGRQKLSLQGWNLQAQHGALLCFLLALIYPKAEESCSLGIDANAILRDVSGVNPHVEVSFLQDIYINILHLENRCVTILVCIV